jgi:hypothetical protein
MAGALVEPIRAHHTPQQVDRAVPGASPWGILNQNRSTFWEALGIRAPPIRLAAASGRIERAHQDDTSYLKAVFDQNFASSAAMKLRPGEFVPDPWMR